MALWSQMLDCLVQLYTFDTFIKTIDQCIHYKISKQILFNLSLYGCVAVPTSVTPT